MAPSLDRAGSQRMESSSSLEASLGGMQMADGGLGAEQGFTDGLGPVQENPAGGQPQGPAPLAVAAVNQLMGGMAAIPQAQAPGHEPQTNTTVHAAQALRVRQVEEQALVTSFTSCLSPEEEDLMTQLESIISGGLSTTTGAADAQASAAPHNPLHHPNPAHPGPGAAVPTERTNPAGQAPALASPMPGVTGHPGLGILQNPPPVNPAAAAAARAAATQVHPALPHTATQAPAGKALHVDPGNTAAANAAAAAIVPRQEQAASHSTDLSAPMGLQGLGAGQPPGDLAAAFAAGMPAVSGHQGPGLLQKYALMDPAAAARAAVLLAAQQQAATHQAGGYTTGLQLPAGGRSPPAGWPQLSAAGQQLNASSATPMVDAILRQAMQNVHISQGDTGGRSGQHFATGRFNTPFNNITYNNLGLPALPQLPHPSQAPQVHSLVSAGIAQVHAGQRQAQTGIETGRHAATARGQSAAAVGDAAGTELKCTKKVAPKCRNGTPYNKHACVGCKTHKRVAGGEGQMKDVRCASCLNSEPVTSKFKFVRCTYIYGAGTPWAMECGQEFLDPVYHEHHKSLHGGKKTAKQFEELEEERQRPGHYCACYSCAKVRPIDWFGGTGRQCTKADELKAKHNARQDVESLVAQAVERYRTSIIAPGQARQLYTEADGLLTNAAATAADFNDKADYVEQLRAWAKRQAGITEEREAHVLAGHGGTSGAGTSRPHAAAGGVAARSGPGPAGGPAIHAVAQVVPQDQATGVEIKQEEEARDVDMALTEVPAEIRILLDKMSELFHEEVLVEFLTNGNVACTLGNWCEGKDEELHEALSKLIAGVESVVGVRQQLMRAVRKKEKTKEQLCGYMAFAESRLEAVLSS